MISIICIYDERKNYNEKLGQSLILLEDCAYELIVKKRVGDYIQNLHEAIMLSSNELILVVNENAILPTSFMKEIKAFEDLDFGVVGIKGRKQDPVTLGLCNCVGDEVFIIHKRDYMDNPFETMNHQHYLVDYCYRMKTLGKDNYVIGVDCQYVHSIEDDPVIISHLRKKYKDSDISTLDTINDYYPMHIPGRFIKKVVNLPIISSLNTTIKQKIIKN